MTVFTETGTGETSRERPGAGAFWLALAVLASLPLFWFGFESLASAWSTAEYSHGPLIPVISSYLFLRQLRQCPPATVVPRDRWPGFVVVLVAILLAMAGNIARIPDIVTYAYILWIGGLVLSCLGWERGRHFWPPVLHLVFMLPLPNFLYWQVSVTLQFISSEIGVMLVRLADIPVFLDGNIIDLGVYKLHVAEACSGLRYLFPVMSFSYVFAVLYRGPVWHKAVLLLSAAPITVLMNSVRIGIIGIMVDNFGIEYAEGFLHLFEGWVIFISCVVILFGMAWTMQRLQKTPMPLADALDLDFDGIGPQLARALRTQASPVLAAGALAVLASGAAWHLVPPRAPAVVERQPMVLFPMELGDWKQLGPQRQLDPEIARVLAADDFLSVAYARGPGDQGVDLFVAWYARQTEGSGIHSPEVCIPAGGWEMSEIEKTDVTIGDETIRLNRAIIQKGLSRQLVYYWFDQRGQSFASDWRAKAWTLIDGVTMGRTDGALVRLITAIGPEGEAEAEARLRDFLGRALPELPRFVPGR